MIYSDLYGMMLMALAALLAGVVNALAGGGTLITFPVMTALGMPAVSANITNTIALCPGYFGGSWAQRRDLKGQKKRLLLLLPVALAGGVAGGYLLLISGEKLFTGVVPWLILFAVVLLLLLLVRAHILSNHSWVSSSCKEGCRCAAAVPARASCTMRSPSPLKPARKRTTFLTSEKWPLAR